MKKTIYAAIVLALPFSATAQQLLNLGTAANDGTGDNLRSAGIKINTNFFQLQSNVSARVSAAQLNSGRVLYVRTNADAGVSAVAGRPDRPYRYLSNAVLAATSGDTIDVGTGTHWEPTNSMSLLKSNVNWIVPLGTTLAFGTTADGDNVFPVFHDWDGPVRCTFFGGGTFMVSNQLSQVFHVTNALSQVTVFFGDRIEQLGQVAAVEWGEADLTFVGLGDIISGYDAVLGVPMGEPGPLYIDCRDILGGTDGGDSFIEFVKPYSQPGRAYVRARRARGDLAFADNVLLDIGNVDLATNNVIYSSTNSSWLGVNGTLRGATVTCWSNRPTFALISVPDVGSPGQYRTAGDFIGCTFYGPTNRPIAIVTNSGLGTTRFIGSRFRSGWGGTNDIRALTSPQTVYLTDTELGHGLHSSITVGGTTNSFSRLKLYGDIDAIGGVHAGGASEFTNTVDFFADIILQAPGTFQTAVGADVLLNGAVTLTGAFDAVGGTFSGDVSIAESVTFLAHSMTLVGTNMWATGRVSQVFSNTFTANVGGVSNVLVEIEDGQEMDIHLFVATGVTAGFPQATAANSWGGAVARIDTNAWVRMQVRRHGSVTNFDYYGVLYDLAAGYKIEFNPSNHVARTITIRSSERYTNYTTGALTVDCSTDVTANITNAVASSYAITLATPVIGTSGSLGLVSDGSARTLAILSPVAITWLSTNDTASATNILTTASKRSLFAWRVGMGTDGISTNLHCWVKNQTP